MKILLANPPWLKKGFYAVRGGSRWPHFERCGVDYQPFPFFLAIATAVLREAGHEVKAIDALALREDETTFINEVIEFGPDIVFFEISTPSLNNDCALAMQIHTQLANSAKFVFGGLHKPVDPGDLFVTFPNLGVYISGEYELTLREVVAALDNDWKTLSQIKGITYRDEVGSIQCTAPKSPITDLEQLPWAAYDNFQMHHYHDACAGLPKPSVQMWASRGCPYECIFCAWPQIMYGDRSYRVRDPVKVVDELEWLVKRYHFRSAYFDDDTFNIGLERIVRLSQEIASRNLGVDWGIMARADTMDRDTLKIMVECGLKAIKYGVESGNQVLLNRSGKKLNLEKVRETIRWTRELNLNYHLSFAFGLPGETWQTVEETVQLALELDPHSVQFSLITPFPGSEYYFTLKESNMITSDHWAHYDGYTTAVIRTEEMSSEDLVHALNYAEARWRKHLFRRMLRSDGFKLFGRGVRHPTQVLNLLKSLWQTRSSPPRTKE